MNKIKVVGFLQNPWSPYYAGGTWPRESWLRAFWSSRSGIRCKLLLDDQVEIWFDNSTPIVCENPNDVIPADLDHMRKVLNEQKPDVIITFGQPAALAMGKIRDEYKQPVMCLPHPAYRVVTNQLFIQALNHLKAGFVGWIRYMPKRGGAVEISINQ
jgi:hypothetical protein